MMCTEKDPLNCHRCILIGRWFHERQVIAKHILDNGDVEHHEQSIKRLLDLLKLSGPHMFRDQQGILSLAYQLQGEKIAFSTQPNNRIGCITLILVAHGGKQSIHRGP